jgi:hypothetical protein
MRFLHYGRMDDASKVGASHASLSRSSFDQDQSLVNNDLSRTHRLDKVASDGLQLHQDLDLVETNHPCEGPSFLGIGTIVERHK